MYLATITKCLLLLQSEQRTIVKTLTKGRAICRALNILLTLAYSNILKLFYRKYTL